MHKNLQIKYINTNDLRQGGRMVVSERFSQAERQGIGKGGRMLEITVLLAARENNANACIEERDSFKREQKRGAAQERAIEEWAVSAQCWLKNTDRELQEQYGEPYTAGGEALVYDNGTTVVKSIGLDYYISPQLALDRIVLHNFLFGRYAPLVVKAFGRNTEGAFQIIVEQPYIVGEKLSEPEIETFAKGLGFELRNARNWTYATPDIYLSDLHDENVIRTPDGHIAVIDADIRLNTPDLNKSGTRVIPSAESSKVVDENGEPLVDYDRYYIQR
ncbi:MAG: hypothetical protein EOM76_02495 [Sphingobacteriia bacterium]|jgi:hypothetical protein|nr:hypothetical protein [Paludibacteraceae bacterium]NCA79046.1 hypothetical protein [Sphingobacteriia bacterium]